MPFSCCYNKNNNYNNGIIAIHNAITDSISNCSKAMLKPTLWEDMMERAGDLPACCALDKRVRGAGRGADEPTNPSSTRVLVISFPALEPKRTKAEKEPKRTKVEKEPKRTEAEKEPKRTKADQSRKRTEVGGSGKRTEADRSGPKRKKNRSGPKQKKDKCS